MAAVDNVSSAAINLFFMFHPPVCLAVVRAPHRRSRAFILQPFSG